MKIALPQNIKTLLWDVDLSKVSIIEHKKYIIERVLEFGDIKEDIWMNSVYTKEDIIDVISTSKRISAKTGNLYASLYKLSKTNLECLKKPYTQRQNRF